MFVSDKNYFSSQANKTKKIFFTYPIKAVFTFANISNIDIKTLKADFVLTHKDKVFETVTKTIATSKKPLYSNGYDPIDVNVQFARKIFTKRELGYYTVKVYLYKDKKFKTLVYEIQVPKKSF